jgi:hypothetical protein
MAVIMQTRAVKAGADAKAKNARGETALDKARKNAKLQNTKAFGMFDDASY